MPNTELPATSTVQNQWTVIGGSKPTCINKPDDDAVTGMYATVLGKEDLFGHAAAPSAAAIIASVNVDSRAHRYGGATGGEFKAGVELSGSKTYSAAHATIVAWQSWSDDGLAKPGGGSWQPSDIASTRTAIYLGPTIGTGVDCSTVQTNIDWFPAAGMFCYLIGQWLPPILAVASHCLMKREIIQILSGLLTRPSNDEDFARIKEALQRRPVYGFNRI